MWSSAQSNIDKIRVKNDSLIYYKFITDRIQDEIEELKLDQVRIDIASVGLPKLEPSEQLINHKAMSLVYEEKCNTPHCLNQKSGILS